MSLVFGYHHEGLAIVATDTRVSHRTGPGEYNPAGDVEKLYEVAGGAGWIVAAGQHAEAHALTVELQASINPATLPSRVAAATAPAHDPGDGDTPTVAIWCGHDAAGLY